MNPETIIQLRQQLEALREFERKNAPSRLSLVGYWGEFLAGLVALGQAIILPIPNAYVIASYALYVIGTVLAFHGFYLIIRFKMDKRFKLLLEAMLSVGEPKQL
jgi:hypothetical protein